MWPGLAHCYPASIDQRCMRSLCVMHQQVHIPERPQRRIGIVPGDLGALHHKEWTIQHLTDLGQKLRKNKMGHRRGALVIANVIRNRATGCTPSSSGIQVKPMVLETGDVRRSIDQVIDSRPETHVVTVVMRSRSWSWCTRRATSCSAAAGSTSKRATRASTA